MLSKKWQYALGFYIISLLLVFRLALVFPGRGPADDSRPLASAVQPSGTSAGDWLRSLIPGRVHVSLDSISQKMLRELVGSHISPDSWPDGGLQPPTVGSLESYYRRLIGWLTGP